MSTWYSDLGYHSDAAEHALLNGTFDISMVESVELHPFIDRELNGTFDLDMSVISSVGLDLLQLIPEKFRQSRILVDYMDEMGIQVGSWFTSVRDAVKILNTRTTGNLKYLKYLGSLIGVDFPPEDESTTDEVKKNISQAVDWYKVKGTYKSIQIVSMIQKFTVNLYDMYTNDYVNFIMVDWFVGDENENPPGFDSSYYKSPHLGIEILLNQLYTSESGNASGGTVYLWAANLLDNLAQKIEETRPVHVVPHFLLLLNPQTDEFGHVIEVNGEILAKVTNGWEYSAKYFDEMGSGKIWYFDDGEYFDSAAISFINSVTKWVLGNGDSDITDPGWSVSSPILSGNIDTSDITITDEKVTFEFVVPKNLVQNGIKELGLYIPGTPDVLVAGATFQSINKDSRVELRVLFEVHRKSLV